MSKEAGYGHALYELAADEGIEIEIEKEFAQVSLLFESNHDFLSLLSNPRISTSERTGIIDNVFGRKIQPYLLYLLKLLVEKRDISLASLCFKEYQNRYYIDKNILMVTAISARALTENQIQLIKAKLEKLMKKTIILENKVDKTCIGGIILEYRGYMIDSSIKGRFSKLQNDLKNTDYSQLEV